MTWHIEHCPDSFAALGSLEDGAMDVVITDPPYDAHCQDNQMSGTTLAKVDLPFASLGPDRAFVRELVRVAKRWALSFCTIEDLGRFCDAAGGPRATGGSWVRGGVWYKPNSMGQLSGDRPAAAYEGVGIMHRKDGPKMRWNGRGSFAFWACSGTRGEKERHPNQKPLRLCLELVNKFSEPGELVFDPFCGSGRIGEACMLLGRRYLGLDNDPSWVAKARTRMEGAAWGSMEGKIPLSDCKLEKTDEAYLERIPA
jgi:hypothetical protein